MVIRWTFGKCRWILTSAYTYVGRFALDWITYKDEQLYFRLRRLEQMISTIHTNTEGLPSKITGSIENLDATIRDHVVKESNMKLESDHKAILLTKATGEVNAQISLLMHCFDLHTTTMNRIIDTIDAKRLEDHIGDVIFQLQLAQENVQRLFSRVEETHTRLDETNDMIYIQSTRLACM